MRKFYEIILLEIEERKSRDLGNFSLLKVQCEHVVNTSVTKKRASWTRASYQYCSLAQRHLLTDRGTNVIFVVDIISCVRQTESHHNGFFLPF